MRWRSPTASAGCSPEGLRVAVGLTAAVALGSVPCCCSHSRSSGSARTPPLHPGHEAAVSPPLCPCSPRCRGRSGCVTSTEQSARRANRCHSCSLSASSRSSLEGSRDVGWHWGAHGAAPSLCPTDARPHLPVCARRRRSCASSTEHCWLALLSVGPSASESSSCRSVGRREQSVGRSPTHIIPGGSSRVPAIRRCHQPVSSTARAACTAWLMAESRANTQ